MRKMSMDECLALVHASPWASIITAGVDGMPYAIEATPFYAWGHICFMINPRGGTWRNLQENEQVLVKYTWTEGGLAVWAGVSVFGRGNFVTDAEKILTGFIRLGERIGADYRKAGEQFSRIQDRSPLLCIQARTVSGRCSASRTAVLQGSFPAAAPEGFLPEVVAAS